MPSNLPMPRRPSILLAGLASIAMPLVLASNPAAADAVGAGVPMAVPTWLPWLLSLAGPLLTWLVYAIGSTVVSGMVAGLRAKAKALRAAAAATPDTADDVAAEVQAAALEASAARLESASRSLPGGGKE